MRQSTVAAVAPDRVLGITAYRGGFILSQVVEFVLPIYRLIHLGMSEKCQETNGDVVT